MDLRETTLKRVAAALRGGEVGHCVACGGRVKVGDPYVRVRGMVFHSACARYRRRRV